MEGHSERHREELTCSKNVNDSVLHLQLYMEVANKGVSYREKAYHLGSQESAAINNIWKGLLQEPPDCTLHSLSCKLLAVLIPPLELSNAASPTANGSDVQPNDVKEITVLHTAGKRWRELVREM